MKNKLILFILLIIIASSCVTQKKCNQKFPPQTYTITKDSIVYKDSIIYKSIEVPVYIKGDTITKVDTVIFDVNTGLINSKPIYAETEFAKAVAWVKYSKLNLNLFQKDTTFQVRYDSLVKEAYYWKEQYNNKETTKVITLKDIPKFYQVMSMIGIISIGFFIGVLINFIKNKLKLF